MKKFLTTILILLISFSLVAKTDNGEKLALVLSGGGARGIAHIAIIQELEKRGIVPDMVLGTSIGALVGGFYAAGYTGDEIEKLLKENDITSLVMQFNNKGVEHITVADSKLKNNLFIINFSENGIGNDNGVINDQELNGFLRSNLARVEAIENFDDLSIPFRSVGINSVDGERLIFDSGSMFNALRGSMSLPVFFAPLKLDDVTYIMDGGMTDNMPVDIALDMGADVVLAVDVNDAFNINNKLTTKNIDTLTGAFDAFSWMITITNTKPMYDLATYVLVPDVDDYSTLEFSKVDEILQKGKDIIAANPTVFDELEEKFGSRDKEFVRYKDRPYLIIENIDSPLVNEYPYLLDYIGLEMTDKNLENFEKLLGFIKDEESLKQLDYIIDGTTLVLKPVEYPPSNGVVLAGGIGSIGFRMDGYNPPYFSFDPDISIGLQIYFGEKNLLTFGLIYQDTLTLEFRYLRPLNPYKLFYFVGTDFNYLDLSFDSIGTTYEHIVKNDVGASLSTGLKFNPRQSLNIRTDVSFDFTHLSRIPILSNTSSIYAQWKNNVFLFLEFGLMFKNKTMNIKGYSNFELNIDAQIGGAWTFIEKEPKNKVPDFRYNFSIEAKGELGIPSNKFTYQALISSRRRFSELKEAYIITKAGIMTTDYLFLEACYKARLGNSRFYWEVGIFGEAYHKYLGTTNAYANYHPSLAPFTSIDTGAVGPKLEMTFETDFGNAFFEVYAPINNRFALSIMFGLRP